MNIARRQKYSGQGRTIFKSEKPKVDINFDLNVLNLLCSYIVSENRSIRKGGLINLRNLIDIINMELYQNDIEKMKRIAFIKKGLEARILKGLSNPILIIKYINGGIIDDNLLNANEFGLLSNEELEWINETVSEALKYTFIYNDVDRMIELGTRFKASDYISRGKIVNEIEELITDMMAKFRRARVETSAEMTFSLREGKFEEVITDTHEQLSNPNRRLITGMQGINEITGGGFESQRTYLFFGNAGSRKSITLLNFAEQIKKYNKNFQAKDPTKIPVIVFLTMENSVQETIQRIFAMLGKGDITDYSATDAINLLRTDGELYLRDDSPIDIIIKYVPDKSVDTGYLYTLCEDLEDEGYEVIALIQDHLKRIRSCYPSTDLRLELGAIVNEFKTFAIIKDIPVITNSHLNRDGAKTVDEGLRGNKFDLIRQLGRANVGESMLMIDNADLAFLIGVEYDANGNTYMAFNRVKSRVKVTLRTYLCQPFAGPDSIKLVEDFYCAVPVFKETLKPDISEVQLNNTGLPPVPNNNHSYNAIKDIDDIFDRNKKDDEEINLFNSTSRYRQSTTVYLEDIDEESELINPIRFTNNIRNVV